MSILTNVKKDIMNKEKKINLKEQQTILCEVCGHHFFREVVMVKKVPKELTDTSEDTIVPFPTYCCDKCGHVNEEFIIFNNEV
jgi:uncharacterized Zn finger protein